MITFGYSDRRSVDLERITEVYESGQFSPGPMCREFESRFRAYHQRKFAFFVNSGTDALRLALLALKEKDRWPDGSLVVVPTVTFVATVNTIIQAGLKPFFIDVGADGNLNPWALDHYFKCSGNDGLIKAIMVVHLFGQVANMTDVMRIAKQQKLRVIEDSCESVGSEHFGKKCGTFGDVACFSTYQCHILATGVGGLAITDDWALNDLMRSYANHGRDTLYLPGFRTLKLSRALLSKRFRFVRSGYSCRPSEFEAALGIGQMERLEENLSKRRFVAEQLIQSLEVYGDLHLPVANYGNTHSYMMFPIVIKENAKAKKKDLVWHLERRGIETRDMMPITTQPVFKNLVTQDEDPFGYSMARWINRNGFYIPCHPGMGKKEIQSIRKAFIDFFKK